jgi:rare lipoprotein A
VASARTELEATIADHDVRTEAAVAEAARNALARRLAEEQARAREAAAQAAAEVRDAARRATEQEEARLAAVVPPGTGPSALGAGAARPPRPDAGPPTGRVARQTAAQAALMAAHRFGPVAGLPPGGVATGQVVEGLASWYGPGFDGRPTASGALYDQEGWTVASKELPLGTVLLVTRGARSVLVLVNDRGPFVTGRVLDLSHAVAVALGTVGPGVAPVRAEVVRLP